jgi:transposase-like protein
VPRHQRRDPIFRYRRYEDDIVVLCVRWYISYRLSLRDLVEMMAERGLDLYPSTIWRWVSMLALFTAYPALSWLVNAPSSAG